MSEIALPIGTVVDRGDLTSRGFFPYQLEFHAVDEAAGSCEWDTVGDVPDSAGLYAFVLQARESPEEYRVVYVGLTGNLWMVTKGRLPDGSARPAQRYGRHKYAGVTRFRINGLVATARLHGFDVTHWLSRRPLPAGARADKYLRDDEEALIREWRLRETGWNRG